MTEFLATIIPLALLAIFAIVRRHRREMRKIEVNNLYAARRTEKTYREGPTYFSDRWTGRPIYTAKAEDMLRQSEASPFSYAETKYDTIPPSLWGRRR